MIEKFFSVSFITLLLINTYFCTVPDPKPELPLSQEELFQNQMGHINSFNK